jgi:hypothetical protein
MGSVEQKNRQGGHAMIHWLIHKLGLQRGTIETWWDDEGHLMIGYQCSTCGKIDGAHRSLTWTEKRKDAP